MSKRHAGVALIVCALVLAAAAGVLWLKGSDDAEKDQLAEEYRAAIVGDSTDDVDPNRSGPIALGAVGAVLFLSGVIALVSPSRDS